MAAKHPNGLVIKLLDAIELRQMKIPAAAKEMGIPKDRIYKWIQEGTNPKAGDEKKIIDWLEKSPHETNIDSKIIIDSNILMQQLKGASITLQDYIDHLKSRNEELQADKKFLQDLLKANLVDLSKGQQVLYAFARSILEYQVVNYAAGNKKKEAEELSSLRTLLGVNYSVNMKDQDQALELDKMRK